MITTQDIEFAYRLLLGREPDPHGLAYYRLQAANGLSLPGLRDSILQSDEFRTTREGTREKTVLAGDALVVINANEPEFGRHIAAHKSWEPHILDTLRQELSPGDTFVDIGANVGVMSLNAAKIVGPEGRVIGFEPHPDNICALLKGIAANGFTNVTLNGFALSDEASFFSLIGSSNGYLMPRGITPFQTASLSGDVVLAREDRIDMIKIDVEGHEPYVLKGLKHIIETRRPVILCEFNPRCLKEHIGEAPSDFANHIFTLTNDITVIEHDGARHEIDNPMSLLDMWSSKNREAVASGRLPDGMLHFDILFNVEGR